MFFTPSVLVKFQLWSQRAEHRATTKIYIKSSEGLQKSRRIFSASQGREHQEGEQERGLASSRLADG